MREFIKAIEKKLLPPLMMMVIECQGGRAFAEARLVHQVSVEQREKEQSVYETFGEGYQMFERAIDDTTESELIAAGIDGGQNDARVELKKALPLLWRKYGEIECNELEESYAVARYDMLTEGGKLFFDIDYEEGSEGFNKEDYELIIEDIMQRIRSVTGIVVERVSDSWNANCIIEIEPLTTNEQNKNATGTRPIWAFTKQPGKIFLPIQQVNSIGDIEVEKFIRFHVLAETAVHEFAHVVGLGHIDDKEDLMSPYATNIRLDIVKDRASVPARNLIYSKKYKSYLAVSYSEIAETSASMKLLRWLRCQAIKGTLKDLLDKAGRMPVKRPAKNDQ